MQNTQTSFVMPSSARASTSFDSRRDHRMNAFAERFVRSMKSECLNRMIFFGQASLQHAIGHSMAHYHTERNHQGLANQLLRPTPIIEPSQPVHRRQRLGGMLNYYHRAAA